MPNASALAVKADSMTTSSSNYGSLFTIHILLDRSIKGNSVVALSDGGRSTWLSASCRARRYRRCGLP